MTALDTKALVWLGEGDGFKSFTRSKATAEKWRRGNIHVTPVSAVSPSQGEGPAAEVVEALEEGLDILNSLIANIKRHGNYSPESTCVFIDQAGSSVRAALASLAPRAAQEAPADEQSGETSHIAVSDAMVEAARNAFKRRGWGYRDEDICAALTAALDAERGEVAIPEKPTQAMRIAYDELNNSLGLDRFANFDLVWGKILSHLPVHPLPLKEEVERVLDWYAEQTRLCRLIHSEGDAGRNALAKDGGNRARALLSRIRAGAQEGWRAAEWFCRNCGWSGKEPEATRHMHPRQGAGGYTAACCPSCGHHFNEHEIARYAAPSPEEGGPRL